MLTIDVGEESVRFGGRLRVSFHRTLRIPDDGNAYPLPPGLGCLPIVRIAGSESCEGGALVVPLYQREALWIGFSGAAWKPNAVKVLAGGINAVTGLADDGRGLNTPQDYLVCPQQPWLDGFNLGDGIIRQFVAMPIGLGYAAEASFGLAERGGIEVIVFDPKPGRFPDQPPPADNRPRRLGQPLTASGAEMALAAGGRMRQKIYPDPFGPDIWDIESAGRIHLTLVNSLAFVALTGQPPPPSPIDAATYAAHGLPWFELYDEGSQSLPSQRGGAIQTVSTRDTERGIAAEPSPGTVLPTTITRIRPAQPPHRPGRAPAKTSS